MLKGRRVGTLSAGILLIGFGVLFLLQLFVHTITFKLIASFWPVILILLGLEVLLSYFMNHENAMKYDAGAVFLVIVLTFFAICMGFLEFTMNHWQLFHTVS